MVHLGTVAATTHSGRAGAAGDDNNITSTAGQTPNTARIGNPAAGAAATGLHILPVALAPYAEHVVGDRRRDTALVAKAGDRGGRASMTISSPKIRTGSQSHAQTLKNKKIHQN